MIKKINRKIVFYTLFALLVLVFFLYARFPGKAAGNYILAAVAERYPGVFLSFESVLLSFPPGLKLENAVFGLKDNMEAGIRIERFTVRPRLLKHIAGRASFALSALAYGGTIKGFVDFPGFSLKNAPTKAEIGFDNLSLERLAFLNDKLGRRITGKIGGSYALNGDGQLDFSAVNGSYPLMESLFGFEKLDFNKAEGQFTLKSGVLKINKLRLKSNRINCSLKGEIILAGELKNSAINLSGSMEIATLNNKKVTMLLTGTLGNVKTKYM